MTPGAEPLLELLRDATARDRPALTLTFARVAELLGEMPADDWWSEQGSALRSAGYAAVLDHDRRWVVFDRASGHDPAGALPEGRVDVRLTFTWTGGATGATAWVDGEPVAVELSEESAASLAAAVARGGERSGGSGI